MQTNEFQEDANIHAFLDYFMGLTQRKKNNRGILDDNKMQPRPKMFCVLLPHSTFGIYFNIVDLCGILPYKRMYPYKCGIKINFDILTTQKDQ